MELEKNDSNKGKTGDGKKRQKVDSSDDSHSPHSTTESDVSGAGTEDMPEAEYMKTVQSLLDANPFDYPTWEDHGDENGEKPLLEANTLMQKSGFIELRMIITWARNVPGYQSLLIEDQIALLKASFLELNVLRMGHRSMDAGPNSITFARNLTLPVDKAAKIGWGIDLINCTLDFIKCLKDINLNKTEFAILSAVVLACPDAAGIKDKPAVFAMQSKLLKCLQQYIEKNYPQDRSRYGKVLLKLPLLRTTSAKGAERFLNMTLDGSIEMNALVWEMMNS